LLVDLLPFEFLDVFEVTLTVLGPRGAAVGELGQPPAPPSEPPSSSSHLP